MKRLGLLVLGILLLMQIGTGFSSPLHAQEIDRITDPQQGTYEYFQSIVTGLNETAITAIDKGLKGHEKDPDFAVQQKATDAYKTAAQSNYDAYLKAFNEEKEKGTLPAPTQIKATQAWITASKAFNPNTFSSSPQKEAYSQYSLQVQKANGAAVRIQSGNVTAGSLEDTSTVNASAITNAAAGNKNIVKQVQKDPKECSLSGGNLVSCIDTLFAWIIKHTLLQLAGFLVWLSANMLNYAVQTGILDFAKWAPEALYPIWIIIRQIVSLAVVFAGLYLGFMYIIGREDTFGKYIGWVILFALFVNFSYPITRALIDVSNVVSLNIYTNAVGTEPLVGTPDASAGGMIMNRLGLQGLVESATKVKSAQEDFISGINSTPGALIAVAFVAYAAYIFFVATQIIAIRTAVLVFLTIASPLLLVDAVVPKLGEVAVKMRKMYLEQLVVAPVFMIMLALTLKFMEIFQNNGPLKSAASAQTALQASGDGDIKTFFGILMMLIMLHIMLKVTKSAAGSAGEIGTKWMGKVGGFGLGVASMGTGVLARGSIGRVAAGARDSKWMDTMKDSKIGRGLYGFSNSLAQSTYDTRNIGMVSKGMAAAGLTGGMGVTMQSGLKKNFDDKKKDRNERVEAFGATIRDDNTRQSYFQKMRTRSVSDNAKLDLTASGIQEKKDAQLTTLMSTTDATKRGQLINQALASKDFAMADKLKAGDKYLEVDNMSPEAVQKKAALLKSMGLTDDKVKNLVNKQDPFTDLNKAHDTTLKQLELDLGKMKRNTDDEKKAYDEARTKIGAFKSAHEDQINDLRKATLAAYSGTAASTTPQQQTSPAPSPSRASAASGYTTTNGSMQTTRSTQSYTPVTAKTAATTILNQTTPMTEARITELEQPAYERKAEQAEARTRTPEITLETPTQAEARTGASQATTQPSPSNTPVSLTDIKKQSFDEMMSAIRNAKSNPSGGEGDPNPVGSPTPAPQPAAPSATETI